MTSEQHTFEGRIAGAFGMDDDAWARHANPKSVWSRLTCLPAIVLSLWAFAWIGPWALVLLAAALWWTWANPRLFPPPVSTDNWASKAVFGERIYAARDNVPIPERHRGLPGYLTGVAVFGIAVTLWGTIWLNAGVTLLGLVIFYLAKLWFADRMVWLFEDAHASRPEYRAWLR
jgi:hypothetical protein